MDPQDEPDRTEPEEEAKSYGLMLTVEVMHPGATTYGDLLNSIAAAWRGREELQVKPGQDGGIKDDSGAPVGLWLIDFA